jgi:hypothetical protein
MIFLPSGCGCIGDDCFLISTDIGLRKLLPEVGIPSLLQDKLTGTGFEPRGILRRRLQVTISGVSHVKILMCFRTNVP